jgi:hypothetical protein
LLISFKKSLKVKHVGRAFLVSILINIVNKKERAKRETEQVTSENRDQELPLRLARLPTPRRLSPPFLCSTLHLSTPFPFVLPLSYNPGPRSADSSLLRVLRLVLGKVSYFFTPIPLEISLSTFFLIWSSDFGWATRLQAKKGGGLLPFPSVLH